MRNLDFRNKKGFTGKNSFLYKLKKTGFKNLKNKKRKEKENGVS